MGKGITLSSANFQSEVLDAKEPVLVDFWATWCGPCRMLGTIVDEIAEEYDGKARVGKVNTEENADLAGEYGVISIPSIIFFKEGKPVDQIIGVVPKKSIKEKLDALIA